MSWTSPGQGFKLEEKVQQNNKPDNPRDQVGDAANRRTEYSHIYVTGLKPDVAKQIARWIESVAETSETVKIGSILNSQR